jgi:hypothetical protein
MFCCLVSPLLPACVRYRIGPPAYQAGYSTALEDVLEYLQQGLDIHQGQPSEGLAEVIDYIEVSQLGRAAS